MLLTTDDLLHDLQQWQHYHGLRPLDVAFARFLYDCSPKEHPLVLLAAALTSANLGKGHPALPLDQSLSEVIHLRVEEEEDIAQLRQLKDWVEHISLKAWTAILLQSHSVSTQPNTVAPLYFDSPRLYLRRYYQYECQVANALQQRFKNKIDICLPDITIQQTLTALFPTPVGNTSPDWQKVAAALAIKQRFAVISGGPGTGKTTTVVKILAALQILQSKQQQKPLVIRLAAPTGKAAARLTESIGQQLKSLSESLSPLFKTAEDKEKVIAALPTQVATLHRLLGARPESRKFKYHSDMQLPLDVLVIDEASMIDLEMMAKLLDALPPDARLILLGDHQQLASVEAGTVLGSLCMDYPLMKLKQQNEPTLFASSNLVNHLTQMTGIQLKTLDDSSPAVADHIVMLRHSHRFNAEEGIGQLAKLLQQYLYAEPKQQHELWEEKFVPFFKKNDTVATITIHDYKNKQWLDLLNSYKPYLDLLKNQNLSIQKTKISNMQDQWAEKVLDTYNDFQILTAIREGVWGVEGVNQVVENHIKNELNILSDRKSWYHGRPVMVTKNNYNLDLMNGDIGITLRWSDPEKENGQPELRVAFKVAKGVIKWVVPSRLNDVETVFAMTVHKSQGSEFTHTVLVIPDQHSAILTSELIYTAITRSKEKCTLVFPPNGKEVFKRAIGKRVQRSSGLSEKLG